ncbi:MAG: AAA family ATPase [Bacteroidales bacterium]|nr:AAA family ATPase [Bacteroidales bacterium]
MLYPIGIQSFEKIRTGGFVYVDKTALIYRLAASGQYYFLSRPRRFGKSLLVSTMEAYFSGRKELFEGLAMESLEKDWTEYPVLHLDLTGSSYTDISHLKMSLDQHLRKWESLYDVAPMSEDLSSRFKDIIDAAYRKAGQKVVILIDEYEKPIIDNIDNPELMEQFRRELQGFYSVIKGKDNAIRFAFLTGVTKLGKMSIFSGLNNLNDISMDARYADICGISEQELKSTFGESVEELARANELSVDDCYKKLAQMYDGYHFTENSVGIYNPFSLLNTFNSGKFRMYWFETGTPTFLVRYLKQGNYNLDNISRNDVSLETLTGSNYVSPAPITLMYQAGYLTIKGFNPDFFTYNLDYPNEEVKRGFMHSLSQLFAPALIDGELSVYQFVRDVRSGNTEAFMNRLTAFFAGNSYEIQGDLELYFQNVMSIMLKMMGLYVKTEYQTSNGRIDIVFDTDKYVYIIELKRDQSPEIALRQIEEKGYDKPFMASGKRIIKLGINFSSETKTIDGWAEA